MGIQFNPLSPGGRGQGEGKNIITFLPIHPIRFCRQDRIAEKNVVFSGAELSHTSNREAMPAPDKILELVERFQRNRDAYLSGKFNETQVRREFIDPMFKLLGWDMDNEEGHAEAYKDVVHEATVNVGGATKAPDYSFRIGGTRKFFLEAKKPSINIKEDISPAYQLRRYAWSAKLPLSILTDFEEFAVYDCRIKPAQTDKASVARTLYMKFEEYPLR